jgi:hypothetical protein
MPKRIRELEHLRGWNAKHWLRDDGLIEAEITMHPVHFRDKITGKWRDINTRPKQKQMQLASWKGRPAKAFDLVVDEADFDFQAAKFADGWFRFEKDGVALSWRFPGAGKVLGRVEDSKITYAGALGEADLSYTVLPEGVKEEIILPKPGLASAYTVEFEAVDCTPRQETNGAISWLDNLGQVVFITKPPFAEDGKGAREVVGTVLEPVDEDSWRLTLVLAQGWPEDPARAWPVRIDPTTVTIQPATIADACIEQNHDPNTNFGTGDVRLGRALGGDTPPDFICRGLIKFNLSSIPSGAIIVGDGTLDVYGPSAPDVANWYYDIYKCTQDWGEMTVTWNTQPTHDSTTKIGYFLVATWGWVSGTIYQSALQEWLNGTNYGAKILSRNEGTKSYWRFVSREYGTASYRPKLTLTYRTPPNTPTGLTPGSSTSEAATKINTVTPTLSWTFSDPDAGDTQSAYQVLIYRTSDNVLVKDTGEVASSVSSYTIPSGVLAQGVGYYWKVRVKDSYGLWSNYSTNAYIYTNRAPSASPVSPLGTSANPAKVLNTLTPTLSWSFSDPDGDARTGYQVLIKRASDGAIIKDTGEVASGSTSYTVPSGLLAYGTTYYWQVRVKDPYGLWSGYTTAQYFQPNQSAAAPTNLSPSGTSTTPATITTLTPRLTWQHNDPENEPQSKYQVLIYRASDNVLVYDTGEVVSPNQYHDVPSGKLVASQKYYWRVHTADTGSSTFGPYSSDAYIYTNAAPYAPTNLTPIAGSILDPTKNQTFSWTFQDPDTGTNADGQSAYQLLIKRTDGTIVYDSGKVVSTTSQHVLPANTITTGPDPNYQWQVRCWDKQDVAGPYSSLVSFRTGTPPAASFTNPVDGGTYPRGILTVAWNYTDAETDPQASFRVVLKDQAGKVLEDSGQVAGDATSYRFNTILSNNTPYRLELTVWDATGQSNTAVSNFTTAFIPPVAPVLSVVPDSTGGKIIVTIGNPDDDPGKPATSYNDLYRRENNSEWIRIVAGMPLNSWYDDYAVSSDAVVEYKAIGVSVDMTTAESNIGSTSITLSGIWLHDIKDPATTKLNIICNSDIKTNRRLEANFLQFAGRSKPVVEFSPQEEYRYSLTLYTTYEFDYWDQLEQLLRGKATLCIRDYRGRKIFGVVTELTENDLHFGEQIPLEIIEVDYTEAV